MPTSPYESSLPHLVEVDAEFRAAGIARRSAGPHRDHADDLVTLAGRLLGRSRAAAIVDAFDRGLAQVAIAILESFPDNIFWDLDRLAAELLARGDAPAIAAMADRVARLQRGFGQHGPISFRYVHDFVFGFDWARWVARDPNARGAVKPFDDAFLDYLERRMLELRELIVRDDAKYHQLDASQRWRNPFGFSRDPDDEARLVEHLAAAGNVPVLAWQADGASDWRRPYGKLRRDAAAALGIAWED